MKHWKLSYEDFRNHTRWSDYETAIEDMMEETATRHAPWHLIPANNKPYGRIVAFRILADRLGKDVSLDPRPIDPDLFEEAKRTLSLSASDIERASHPAKRKIKLKQRRPGELIAPAHAMIGEPRAVPGTTACPNRRSSRTG